MKNKKGFIHLLPLVLVGVVIVVIIGLVVVYTIPFGDNFNFPKVFFNSPDKVDTVISNDSQIFENSDFRILYPRGWYIEEGDGVTLSSFDLANTDYELPGDIYADKTNTKIYMQYHPLKIDAGTSLNDWLKKNIFNKSVSTPIQEEITIGNRQGIKAYSFDDQSAYTIFLNEEGTVFVVSINNPNPTTDSILKTLKFN